MAKAQKLLSPEKLSLVDGPFIEVILAAIDGLVESSGKPFIKLAWGLIRQWLKPKAVAQKIQQQ